MRPNDADGMANRIDPNRSSPIWVYAVCYDLSVLIFRISMVLGPFAIKSYKHILPGVKSRLEDQKRAFIFWYKIRENIAKQGASI